MRMCWTHKQLEELEDPLVCEDVKCVSCDWINDRQAVDFVFDECVHSIKQAATQHTQLRGTKKPSGLHRKALEIKGWRGTWRPVKC